MIKKILYNQVIYLTISSNKLTKKIKITFKQSNPRKKRNPSTITMTDIYQMIMMKKKCFTENFVNIRKRKIKNQKHKMLNIILKMKRMIIKLINKILITIDQQMNTKKNFLKNKKAKKKIKQQIIKSL